ncbi:MAG: hypothetical protein ACREDK_06105 [Thermoplasmata archaeon]
MVAQALETSTTKGTLSTASLDIDTTTRPAGRVRRIGRVRIPIALTVRPWATLYALPDGRRWWIVRLWEVDRPVPRVLTTTQLLVFARCSGLVEVTRAIDDLVERARTPSDDAPE